MDSYIRGIRWASNRIKDNGVIAFVSNGSFLDANSMDGIRKTFAAEFSRIFVYNLRGNQRTTGETSRKEGGKVFGSGSRTQVAICVVIKNAAHLGPAEIRYRDIGDYLTREQKLDILTIEQSLKGTDWETITPNDHGDWINHRDDSYDAFQPIGDKVTKGKPATPGMFENYSLGLGTNRDAWCFNFSREAVSTNMKRTIDVYNSEIARAMEDAHATQEMDKTKIAWSSSLESTFKQRKHSIFSAEKIVSAAYRPFCRQSVYFDGIFNHRVNQLPRIFPTPAQPNIVIVTSVVRGKGASTLVADALPDLHLVGDAQCFSFYTYEPASPEAQGDLFAEGDSNVIDGYRRKENITDATLSTYRGFYEEASISKEDIFYYVYGLLHSPTYKVAYKADLMKMLPRIPKVKDFWGYSTAGRALADLHLNYETVAPADLTEVLKTEPPADAEAQYDYYRVQKLSWGARKDRSRITFNSNITLEGIPAEALDYQVNGKSAIEWIIDRYQVTTHKDSQLTNDPNDYCREVGDPRYIIDLIKRIVTVSVETNKIVAGLPALEIVE